MDARKVLAGFAALALGIGVLASMANAAPLCGSKACRDEAAASGHGQCKKSVPKVPHLRLPGGSL